MMSAGRHGFSASTWMEVGRAGSALDGGVAPAGYRAFPVGRMRHRRCTYSGLHGDFAREPLGTPVEQHLALQLDPNHAVHHARAEALVRGRRHRRAARLNPPQNEPPFCRTPPFDFNATVRHRQGAMLGGVSSQLMQGHRDGLRNVRFQRQLRAVNARPRVLAVAVGRKLLRDQSVQVGRGPTRLREKRMDIASAWMRPSIASLRPLGVSDSERCAICYSFRKARWFAADPVARRRPAPRSAVAGAVPGGPGAQGLRR
jgi:hypothetical protein